MIQIIERFKANNRKFPKITGDWYIKEMLRRSINNKRAHQRKKKLRRNENKSDDDNDDVDDASNEDVANSNSNIKTLHYICRERYSKKIRIQRGDSS
ncbi:hypothetical protein RclHR1_19630004 [Rhizophagus clarus]|uniref:Uncharacterized protein n=1 Tax=Rhizophagus clarus TaxID=94130 RepID=A0A2Z6QPV4_9GLOM|nr:hypothetical protein RclHR1_19630004 [Rhizophagus clarus]